MSHVVPMTTVTAGMINLAEVDVDAVSSVKHAASRPCLTKTSPAGTRSLTRWWTKT